MSRSFKKTPIFPVCQCEAGYQKRWKKQCNRRFRRNVPKDTDIANGTDYRKIFQTIWDSPSDGKSWRGHPRRQNCFYQDQNARLTKRDMRK
jgi:hypothetical protein